MGERENIPEKDFTIVLPAFNEEKTIVKTVEAAIAAGASEIIVVNDGSTDNTATLLTPFLKSYRQLRIISHSKNQGCGIAKKTGILSAINNIVLICDSDIENINEDMLIKLVTPLLKREADFVLASFENFGRVAEYLVKPLLSFLVPKLAHLKQPISGMFALYRSYIDPEKMDSGYGMAGILLNAYFKGAKISEVDIGTMIHRHRSDKDKRDHALTACKCILRYCAEQGIIKINSEVYKNLRGGNGLTRKFSYSATSPKLPKAVSQ